MDLTEFPNVAAWIERVSSRPGAKAGLALTSDTQTDLSKDKDARAILFNQRAAEHRRATQRHRNI